MPNFISNKKISKISAGKARFTASALALPIALFLIFWVFVNFDSILLAFEKEEYPTIEFNRISADSQGESLVGAWSGSDGSELTFYADGTASGILKYHDKLTLVEQEIHLSEVSFGDEGKNVGFEESNGEYNVDWIRFDVETDTLSVRSPDLVEVFTFDNFQRVWTDFFTKKDLLLNLRNTTLFYLAMVLVILPISIVFSYFIYKKIFMYKFFRVIIYLPTIISGAALVALYKYTFLQGGPYDAIVTSLGGEWKNLFYGENAVAMLLIYNCLFGLGGYVVILGGAMNSIDNSVIEAGKIDGCNWLQELFGIILPMVWPTLSTILLLGLASFVSSTGPILAMTKNNESTYTLAYILYSYATGVGRNGATDIYYASAVGLTLSVLSIPLVFVCRKLLNKIGE